MKSGNRELLDRLAAEYVLGTLRGRARRHFERWMVSPQVVVMVNDWEQRLAGLEPSLQRVTPPARVWQAIESRLELGGSGRSTVRWLAIAATVLLAVLGIFTLRPVPPAVDARRPSRRIPDYLLARRAARRQPGAQRAGPACRSSPARHTSCGSCRRRAAGIAGSAAASARGRLRQPARGAKQLAVGTATGSPTGLPTGPVLFVAPLAKA